MVVQDLNLGGIWRKRGELLDEGTYEREAHPLHVMVWGAIGPNYRSNLIRCPPRINAETYRAMLDENKVIDGLNRRFLRRGYVWQQDNAPSHQKAWKDGLCSLVRTFRGGIMWSPYSPDLTPIEHMWAISKELVKGRKFTDEDELFTAISEAWDSIPIDVVNRLVNSFRARCRVCLELNGGCLNRHWQRVSKLAEQLAQGTAH
jgi:hypothetical protein